MRRAREGELATGAIATITIALAYMYFRNVQWEYGHHRALQHFETLGATIGAPYRYRILTTYLAEIPRTITNALLPDAYGFPVMIAYLLVETACLLFSIVMLYKLLRLWFNEHQAVLLLLLGGISLAVSGRDHFLVPSSWPEPGLIAAAIYAMYFERRRLLLLLVILATLNRETGVQLAILAASMDYSRFGVRRGVMTAALGMIAWAATYGFIRVSLGAAEPEWSLGFIWQLNKTPRELIFAAGALMAVFGALWWWAPAGWQRAPKLLRAAAVIVPIQFVLYAVWGHWVEVRLLTTLLPVVLPLAGFYLFESANTSAADDYVATVKHT